MRCYRSFLGTGEGIACVYGFVCLLVSWKAEKVKRDFVVSDVSLSFSNQAIRDQLSSYLYIVKDKVRTGFLVRMRWNQCDEENRREGGW